ncbi:uncharacterized protein BCR38DRAFT_308462, partial [Pseudomassariella vexata]
ASQLQSLEQYCEACHPLNLALEVVTDCSLTTQGSTTNPTGRVYPQRILQWEDFTRDQNEIWDKLLIDSDFPSNAVPPSSTELSYVKRYITPISSEMGLRHFEHKTVENMARRLVGQVYNQLPTRSRLGLQETITFESHTNLAEANSTISESMEQMSLAS